MKPEEKQAMIDILTEELKQDVTTELTNDEVANAFKTIVSFCLSEKRTKLIFTMITEGVACPVEFIMYEPFPVPKTSDDRSQKSEPKI